MADKMQEEFAAAVHVGGNLGHVLDDLDSLDELEDLDEKHEPKKAAKEMEIEDGDDFENLGFPWFIRSIWQDGNSVVLHFENNPNGRVYCENCWSVGSIIQ